MMLQSIFQGAEFKKFQIAEVTFKVTQGHYKDRRQRNGYIFRWTLFGYVQFFVAIPWASLGLSRLGPGCRMPEPFEASVAAPLKAASGVVVNM